jgi:hypothetical protein
MFVPSFSSILPTAIINSSTIDNTDCMFSIKEYLGISEF